MSKTVLICQNVTCKQQGAEAVLTAFQKNHPSGTEIKESGCLGQCGNGPMVIVIPEKAKKGSNPKTRSKTWYSDVRVRDVSAIVEQHLKNDRPVSAKLYPAVHGTRNSIGIWIVGFFLFLSLCILIGVVVGMRSPYPY
ncbi:MAG: (2Fe-2S) ferredoxin domain-containing protein [Cyanobacteria bacterium J06614_10]